MRKRCGMAEAAKDSAEAGHRTGPVMLFDKDNSEKRMTVRVK